MRITAGEFGGLNLRVPGSGRIRPTQDRVREALFSMLHSEIPGCDFLDLFAGTGSAGLEALSRGARHATFVEADAKHLSVLRDNARFCLKDGCAGRADFIRADVYRWISSYRGPGFSAAFADPPYALGESRGYASVLATLKKREVVRPGGLFIAEMTAVQKPEETPGWELLKDRTYGKTRLSIWRNLL